MSKLLSSSPYSVKFYHLIKPCGVAHAGKDVRWNQQPMNILTQGFRHLCSSDVCDGMQGKAIIDLVIFIQIFPYRIDDKAEKIWVFMHKQCDGKVPLQTRRSWLRTMTLQGDNLLSVSRCIYGLRSSWRLPYARHQPCSLEYRYTGLSRRIFRLNNVRRASHCLVSTHFFFW